MRTWLTPIATLPQVISYRDADVLSSSHPEAFPHPRGADRPLGMTLRKLFRLVASRVPRRQMSGNLRLLARMVDVLHLEDSSAQTFVTAKTLEQDVRAVGSIPRNTIKAVASVLAWPRHHPERRRLLESESPLVRALVTTLRRTVARIDMTDAYYRMVHANLRAVYAATGVAFLMFNVNPADLHSAAAVHAAGQVIEFNDTGAPVQEQGIVRKWTRVRDNPHASQALLQAVKVALLDVLFGFKPGEHRQSNPDCFCGVVFHVGIKVEQSGRLALHLHGIAHLAAFTVENISSLFRGPNCRALALAHALCSMWMPEPYYDVQDPEKSVHWQTPEHAGALPPATAASVAAAATEEPGDAAARALPLAAERTRGPAEPAPATNAAAPPPAYDFGIVARGKQQGLTPPQRRARCARHLAAAIAGSCTHKHTDTCKRHGCAGVDGDCGMVFPRHVRREVRWVEDTGLFALPRYGPNLVSQCPAVTMSLGCNNAFVLACELDREYTAEVEKQLALPPELQDSTILADVVLPAPARSRRAGHYVGKYIAKPQSSGQVAKMMQAFSVTRNFLDTTAGITNATDAAEARRMGIGNIMAAANQVTSTFTVGMAMAQYRLMGNATFEATYENCLLATGPFMAIVLQADRDVIDADEAAAETLLVFPDGDPDAPGAAVTAVDHYRLRGVELRGADCSPYVFTMTYTLAKLPRGKHPDLQQQGTGPQTKRRRTHPATAAVAAAAAADGPADSSLGAAAPAAATGSIPAVPVAADATDHSCRGQSQHKAWVAFHTSHPLYATHALRRLPRVKFTTLLGPVPRRPSADDDDSPGAQRYYAFVLSVFKSYRSSPVPPGMTLRQAYDDWLDNILPTAGLDMVGFVRSVLDNLEAEHECRDQSREVGNRMRRERRERAAAAQQSDSASTCSDEDGPFRPQRQRPAGSDGSGEDDDRYTMDAEDEDDAAVAAGVSQFDVHATDLLVLFDYSTTEGRYACHAARRCSAPALAPGLNAGACGFVRKGTAETMAAVQAAARALEIFNAAGGQLAGGLDDYGPAAGGPGALDEQQAGAEEATRQRPCAPRLQLRRRAHAVLVALLEQVTGPDGEVVATETELPSGSLPPYVLLEEAPSAEDTVQLFTLAVEQAVPFTLLARYFDARNSPQPPRPPRVMVIGGPGTGKSQMVHALLWYTFQHGQPSWLATASFAWTAALPFVTAVHRSVSTHSMFQLIPPNQLKNGAEAQAKVRPFVPARGRVPTLL